MEGSKLGFQVWMIATFLLSTNLKSVSSMKLHRALEITQKSAWFLAHRLRRALDRDGDMFAGPVEVDETYIGGKRKNMSNAKRKELAGTGRGAVGKTAVVGIKDRETKNVRAKVVENTDKATLQGFVVENTAPGATVYTDEASAYEGLPFTHESVKHSVSEYVRGTGLRPLRDIEQGERPARPALQPCCAPRQTGGEGSVRSLRVSGGVSGGVTGLSGESGCAFNRGRYPRGVGMTETWASHDNAGGAWDSA